MARIGEDSAIFGAGRLSLSDIEEQVCQIAASQLQLPRDKVGPSSRLIQDLNCDSLALVELLMALETHFDVSLDQGRDPIGKAVFTRQPFRLSDLAEAVYLQQWTGKPDRGSRDQLKTTPAGPAGVPFSQLGGRWQGHDERPLFERIESAGTSSQFRRRTDGMRCVLLPEAAVIIGSNRSTSFPDESPQHSVQLDSFLIDAELVSTTAYCRFLNSIGEDDPSLLADWFALTPSDKRVEHELIMKGATGWEPVPGTERWPMILVSWYGANAYSLWANGQSWRRNGDADASDPESGLPTEAQWEYAARGANYREWPWGDEPPTPEKVVYGRHSPAQDHPLSEFPLASVNDQQGTSPFGLHHMAGNVWQWCRDWYDEHFYSTPESRQRNPVGRTSTQVRSERGGSWVGPVELCRSSYRRGRPPLARGRCLGFRCVSSLKDLDAVPAVG